MPTDHHNFVFPLRIRARNFRDGVKAVLVITGELGIDIHFNRYRYVRFKQTIDASVTLDRHHSTGNRTGMLATVNEPSEGRAGIVEDRAAGAPVVASVAAGHEHS